MSKVKGHTSYKGLTAQQHNDAFDVFKTFITEIKPKRVLEIGTAGGGLTLFIRDTLNEIGLQDTPIKSFDVVECQWYNDIRKENVEINNILIKFMGSKLETGETAKVAIGPTKINALNIRKCTSSLFMKNRLH